MPKAADAGRIAAFSALVLFLGLQLCLKTDFVRADLGRHLKNGELALRHAPVLRTNFYSYTNPDHPVINHHWLAGVVFYAIHRAAGFEGLGLFHIFLYLAAFFLMFRVAEAEAGWPAASILSLFLMPLMVDREEIRPEAFSVLFASFYFFVLYGISRKKIPDAWMWALPFLQALWVNLHIYFVMGWLVAGSYWAASPKDFRRALLFLAVGAASLAHPSGFQAAIYPFRVFGDYGARVVENLSVWELQKRGIFLPSYVYFQTALLLFAAAGFTVVRALKKLPDLFILLPSVGICILASHAIRNFALFGFFMLPVFALFYGVIMKARRGRETHARTFIIFAAFLLLLHFYLYRPFLPFYRSIFGLGVREGNEAPGEFLRKHGVHEPVFNNFDSGSYLIYYLAPEKKVFIDTRPEAYPASFIRDVYDAAIRDEEAWKRFDAQYHFGSIFFSQDLSQDARRFIIARSKDPQWRPVYADPHAVIFERR